MRLKGKRQNGVLLHITSLPSNYGIGTFGIEAYKFIDFLCETKQQLWQLLPTVVIGEGNSPYKSPSCFAGEPLLIDLDFLRRDGLLKSDELPQTALSGEKVDYDIVRKIKMPLLKKAAERFDITSKDFTLFLKNNEDWIYDYSLFAAITEKVGSEKICDMPGELRFRFPRALKEFEENHPQEILHHQILQYFFYTQFFDLRRYADKRGIKLIGDIPIYVSPDSAEVWTSPDSFCLDRELRPLKVAGVPPDIFSSTGQLWGNPTYDWENQEETDFLWWKKRLRFCAKLYDILRIDHFRAFESFYSIDAKAKNAKRGVWETGPGTKFWKSVKKDIKNLEIIAEDLGGDTPEVKALLKECGFPNMKILQFAFTGNLDNEFLPKNHPVNCACYTGTHDNDTTLGWYKTAPTGERLLFSRVATHENLSVPHKMIALAMSSKAKYVIIPMQDWLELDSGGRMNTPGTAKDNWQWRMKSGAIENEKLKKTMREITRRK